VNPWISDREVGEEVADENIRKEMRGVLEEKLWKLSHHHRQKFLEISLMLKTIEALERRIEWEESPWAALLLHHDICGW